MYIADLMISLVFFLISEYIVYISIILSAVNLVPSRNIYIYLSTIIYLYTAIRVIFLSYCLENKYFPWIPDPLIPPYL